MSHATGPRTHAGQTIPIGVKERQCKTRAMHKAMGEGGWPGARCDQLVRMDAAAKGTTVQRTGRNKRELPLDLEARKLTQQPLHAPALLIVNFQEWIEVYRNGEQTGTHKERTGRRHSRGCSEEEVTQREEERQCVR